jgi:hypothetical protein
VVAEQNVLALDKSMMDIYEGALSQYKQNMLERVPIILALFSEGGGRMIQTAKLWAPAIAFFAGTDSVPKKNLRFESTWPRGW